MKKLYNLTKTVLVAVAIMGLAACNGSDSTIANTPNTISPQNIFTSVTLQNFVTQANRNPSVYKDYRVRITSTGIKTNESSIYFNLPKDAVDKGMLKLNALSLRINTNANESIFIGDIAITPNSNANPLIDFNESANLKLKIIPFGAPSESFAKVFNLYLEPSESANITIESIELYRNKSQSTNIALNQINKSSGLITSVVSYAESLNAQSNLVFYPKFSFAESVLQPTAEQDDQAVTFLNNGAFIAKYTILSHDKNTTAIYSNTLTKVESSVAPIISFKLDDPKIESIQIVLLIPRNGNIYLHVPAGVGQVTGKTYITSFGESIEIGVMNPESFTQGKKLAFYTPTQVTVHPYNNKASPWQYIVELKPETTTKK